MYNKICSQLWLALDKLKQDARGVSAIEYAILAGVIIVIVAGAIVNWGDDIRAMFDHTTTALSEAREASDAAAE